MSDKDLTSVITITFLAFFVVVGVNDAKGHGAPSVTPRIEEKIPDFSHGRYDPGPLAPPISGKSEERVKESSTELEIAEERGLYIRTVDGRWWRRCVRFLGAAPDFGLMTLVAVPEGQVPR